MNKYEKEDWLHFIKESAKIFGFVLAWIGAIILWLLIFLGLTLLFNPDIAEIIMLSATVLGIIIFVMLHTKETEKQEDNTKNNTSDKKTFVEIIEAFIFRPSIPQKLGNSRYKIFSYLIYFLLLVGFYVFFGDLGIIILLPILILSDMKVTKKLKQQDEAAKNNIYKKFDAMENKYNFISDEQAEREKYQETDEQF